MDVGALLDGAAIAITGGTGTLGNALVSEILAHHRPHRIVLLSRSESRQAAMRERWPESDTSPLRYFVGDVRDAARCREALEGCQIIIHAAALKRIEVCEREPKEAVLTNVLGTLNVAEAARQSGAERFIFVSSDKCCAAATLYGGTKYVGERLVIGMNNYRGQRSIRYSAVRYGNVLGSTGSVLHLFKASNGKVPITHPEMTRFWITPQQAARFVLSSLAMMRGGETFVPRLPAMAIADMAAALAPKAKTETIGMRGVEKIHEAMLSEAESPWVYELPDRYVLLPAVSYWSGGAWPEARPVPLGWSYTSANAERRLTGEELREMLSSQ